MAPELTHELAAALLDKLINAYVDPKFQKALWAAFIDAGDEVAKQKISVSEACSPLEDTIVVEYGFETMSQAIAALTGKFRSDPWIASRLSRAAVLLNPTFQLASELTAESAPALPLGWDDRAKAATGASGAAPSRAAAAGEGLEAGQQPAAHETPTSQAGVGAESPRQHWTVVGGGEKGGIIVRSKVELRSAELPKRLATGSVVEELAKSGDRLHFRRVHGDGPDTGWVSIAVGGKALMEPCE
mmetsp:Transcript_80530/g.227966  ORF Transcript_80530/g.227966 Transcript_80530/m.227966 type:complete len:244 (-) Transcript_80530:78-809(-)